MSRAYRIKVKESIKKHIKADDGVSSRLDILQVLPPEQMEQLLECDLQEKGYEKDGDCMKKELEGGVIVSVNLKTDEVTVSVSDCDEVELEKTKEGYGESRKDESRLCETVKKELEREVSKKECELQEKVTDKLEKELRGLKTELDQTTHHVIAEALKIKAASMGNVKEVTEDIQAGSMTIVVEV